jgi:hypothetical protein
MVARPDSDSESESDYVRLADLPDDDPRVVQAAAEFKAKADEEARAEAEAEFKARVQADLEAEVEFKARVQADLEAEAKADAEADAEARAEVECARLFFFFFSPFRIFAFMMFCLRAKMMNSPADASGPSRCPSTEGREEGVFCP